MIAELLRFGARLLLRRAAASLLRCPRWKLSKAARSFRAISLARGLEEIAPLLLLTNERLEGTALPPVLPFAASPVPAELRVLTRKAWTGSFAASSAARFSPSLAMTLEREIRGRFLSEPVEVVVDALLVERGRSGTAESDVVVSEADFIRAFSTSLGLGDVEFPRGPRMLSVVRLLFR